MSVLTVTTPYVDGGTVTSTNLNALVGTATFAAASVDNVTTEVSGGSIVVRDAGISKPKLSANLQGITEKVGTAFITGDKTGNARGGYALDVQVSRINPTDVASGSRAIAFGRDNTASNYESAGIGVSNTASGYRSAAFGGSNTSSNKYSSSFGFFNNATGYRSMAFGDSNTATGYLSSAVGIRNNASDEASAACGHSNTASGYHSSAIGVNNTAIGSNGHAIGQGVINNSASSLEMGVWDNSGIRKAAIKLTEFGGVAFTLENSASAPIDQATMGSETGQQLGRGMFTVQRNGNAFTLYLNDGGTIKSLALGSVA